MSADDQFLTSKHLRARYGNRTDRTIDRWVASGILPAPKWINNRRYWSLSELEQRERENIARRHRGETVA